MSTQQFYLRVPVEEDGIGIWELVKSTKVLDLNSPYSYLMLCKYFSDTCVVTEMDNKIVGFISGFRSPADPTVLFIWQVAVDKSTLRRGLGLTMLKHLVKRNSNNPVHYLEITVNPSNEAAYKLYRKLALELDTSIEEIECFPSHLFPGGQHEKEILLRIGPLQ